MNNNNKTSADKIQKANAIVTGSSSGIGGKRFTSMLAVSMHLKMTATRHIVNFNNYGNYDNMSHR